MLGSIKFYNRTKGYGFLRPDDNGSDLFIAPSEAQFSGLDLRDGDRVEFDKAPNPRREGGFIAKNLRTPLPNFVR